MSDGWILVTEQCLVTGNNYFSDFLIVAAKTKILIIVLNKICHLEEP